jgi:hypothetical protein
VSTTWPWIAGSLSDVAVTVIWARMRAGTVGGTSTRTSIEG